jgi:hypothetical protein
LDYFRYTNQQLHQIILFWFVISLYIFTWHAYALKGGFADDLMQIISWQANVIRKTTVLDVMRRLLQVRNFIPFCLTKVQLGIKLTLFVSDQEYHGFLLCTNKRS